ncbi:MAG TPA: succinate dehydrogenase, hydrophobic membrane anchor protein [Novosphingobium sp.]|nr:succinate dehydrogenase, hydrophobic membrane anchor protein [Novosphingobium sp.]
MGEGTPLGRVRGIGSAHSGAHHWLLERLTGVFTLVPIVWLIVSLLLLPDFTYKAVHGWIVQPIPALMVALLLIATFWHTRLGLRVFIEDYIHTGANKLAALLALDLFIFVGAAAGLMFLSLMVMGGLGQDAAKAEVQSALKASMGAR